MAKKRRARRRGRHDGTGQDQVRAKQCRRNSLGLCFDRRLGGRNDIDCTDGGRVRTVIDDNTPRAGFARGNVNLRGQGSFGGLYGCSTDICFARPFQVQIGNAGEIVASNRQRLSAPLAVMGLGLAEVITGPADLCPSTAVLALATDAEPK